MNQTVSEFKTACRGCHGGCIHILTVENGRVTGIRPDPEGPLNRGHACEKGMTVIEQMYHPDRLTKPMRRLGPRGSGKWEYISWDEALDTIAEKLTALRDQYGPECISTITGTGRHLVSYLTRFGKALGTPNIASAGAIICLGPRKNAGYSTSGIYNCVDYYGEVDPACIVVWGSNPAVSGADGELQWHPKRCAQKNTKFIVIDPQKTELAEQAELWLRLRPGTDGALALGILNIIIQEDLYDHEFVENWTYGFEELKARCAEYDLEKVSQITWVPKEQILKAARMMASVKPMSLEWGCAFEQSFNAMQTCRAIYMIPALTGNYDVPGGFIEGKRLVSLRRDPQDPGEGLINDFPYRNLRQCANPHQVLDAVKMSRPYKIRAMLSFANNALLSLPDSRRVYESLTELEFFVCMDLFMTPTAELADIVLPAALWPELDCVFYMPEFSEQAILCQQKVAQVGECRPDEDVFIELSKRMGLNYGADSQIDLINQELASVAQRHPELAGMTFDKLKMRGCYTPEHTYYNYKKRGGFYTPTGKFELWSKEVEQLGGDPLPFWTEPPVTPVSRPDLKRQFPYILTTGGRRMQYFISNNRQIRSLRRQYPFPLVRMHPDTAAANGIQEGDWVYIRTFRGRITQKAKLDPDMDPQVINCDFGWWYPEAGAPGYGWDESNANILTSCDDGCDDYLGSYQLRGLLCNIYKNDSCQIEERYYNSPLYADIPGDDSSPCISINHDKCILCGECVNACQNVQSVGALEIRSRDGLTYICAKEGRLSATSCVGCGQCRAACPTGALRIKSHTEMVKAALADEKCFTVVQLAPSVRVGVGGHLGFPKGGNSMSLLADALKKLGFDRVYDTTFSADLTVLEEAKEFLARLEHAERLPLFTSCCPAWVKFCEERYPELKENISTCRSPQQMLGAVIRDYFGSHAQETTGKRLVSVSVMPCTAKKAEILRPESHTHGVQDVDFSLTTVELLELLEDAGIHAADCTPAAGDAPFSHGSGGGTVFGVSGGVTEAVLRYISGTPTAVSQPQAENGLTQYIFDYQGRTLRFAVVSGLANADALIQKVLSGEESFDLIEVMACPGGCIMGGGQPADSYELLRDRACRTQALSRIDEESNVRLSHDNSELTAVCSQLISGKEHLLLHRNFNE